jgi:hypothetical protein
MDEIAKIEVKFSPNLKSNIESIPAINYRGKNK